METARSLKICIFVRGYDNAHVPQRDSAYTISIN